MEKPNLLTRIYAPLKEENLSDSKKAEIITDFVWKFFPEKPNKGLFERLFSKKIPKRFNETELTLKLVEMGLSQDEKDAQGLMSDVISRDYDGDLTSINHYEFQPSKDKDGNLYYEMKTFIWSD